MPNRSVQQLVVDVRSREIIAVRNEAGLDWAEFDHPEEGKVVPRLGSLDLLRLAASAGRFGYIVMDVVVRDRTMNSLPMEAEEELSGNLVAALRDGLIAQAQALLRGIGGPLAVVGVHLVDDHDGDVHVGRLGTFEADSDSALSELIEPAWKELQLS